MNKQVKTIAIINSTAPFATSNGKDALDVALIFASYDQAVSLFFQGDGVYQLTNKQSAETISAKDYLKTFAAFEFYDIEHVYACQASLTIRGLSSDFHIDGIKILDTHDFSMELAKHNNVFRF